MNKPTFPSKFTFQELRTAIELRHPDIDRAFALDTFDDHVAIYLPWKPVWERIYLIYKVRRYSIPGSLDHESIDELARVVDQIADKYRQAAVLSAMQGVAV